MKELSIRALAVAAGVFSVVAVAADAQVPFGSRQVIDQTGDNPRTVIAVDLDQDGDLDLVNTYLASNEVVWHENSGGANPTYTTRLITAAAQRPREVWADDIDQDGDIDIALASSQDKTVWWLENTGGTPLSFTPHVIFDDLTNAWSVYVADVDHDGDRDVLSIGGQTENTVNWHENEGGPSPFTWTRHVIDDDAGRAEKVFVDDVNGDGNLDLLSASGGGGSQEIAWYASDGAADPTFTKEALTNNLTNAKWVWSGDLDGDGDRDIIGVGEFAGEVRWWENGGGTSPSFTERQIGVVPGAKTATPVDLDFDGDVDVIAHGIGLDEIVMFENNGATPPVFTRHVLTTESDNPLNVTPADLDGDGDLDLAAASFQDDTIGWYQSELPAVEISASLPVQSLLTGNAPVAVEAGDLDRDGRVDLVVASRDDALVSWYRNLGAPARGEAVSFIELPISTDFRGPRDLALADLNRDGLLDVVSASLNDDAVVWHRNLGGSPLAFSTSQIGASVNDARSVAVADMDRDGDLDVVAASVASNLIVLLENDGALTPSFSTRTIATGIQRPLEVQIADLNRDGAPDVVVAARDETQLMLLVSDGGATPAFTTQSAPGTVADAKDVRVLDYDRDGDLDLLSGSSVTNAITLHRCDDAATLSYTLETLATGPAGLKSLDAFDFDHDGDDDILASGADSGDVLWLERQDDGSLAPTTVFAGLAKPADVLFADVDGDSVRDLLALDQDGDELLLQALTAEAPTTTGSVTATSTSPETLNEGTTVALFALEVDHLATSGLAQVTSNTFNLRMENASGGLLSSSISNNLFSFFGAYVDDGDGVFEASEDQYIGSAQSFNFGSDGLMEYVLQNDMGPLRVPSGETALVHVAGTVDLGAVKLEPPAFRVTLDPSEVALSSAIGDPGFDRDPEARTPLLSVDINPNNQLEGLPWRRHTVDDSRFGAESVHCADIDGDGLTDFVVGWEQSSEAIVYFNPGPGANTAKWPELRIGTAIGVETSTPADLDGDGRLDVISSLETGGVNIHWAPAPGQDITNPANWETVSIPAPPDERWGPLEAIQIDGEHGLDLAFGALGSASDFEVPVAWLRAPADPRVVEDWTYHEIGTAAFVTTIIGRDMDSDGDQDVVWTNRLFDSDDRAAWWFENPGPGASLTAPWAVHLIGSQGRMPMTMDLGDIDGDGLEDAAVPDRDYLPDWHRRLDATGLNWSTHAVAWPSDMGRPKAFAIGDIDLDGAKDLVATAVQSVEGPGLVGVAWLRQPESPMQFAWTPYNIGGADGEKFDRIELIDLDQDGDLDVVTTEERNNSTVIRGLGVVWYENPTIELDGDVNRDGVTGAADLGILLAAWGETGVSLSSDLDNDGTVGAGDLGILLAAWGREDADAAP